MKNKVFGCKTNGYFAQKWLKDGDLSEKSGVLIASCVVTDQAKRRWVKFALKTLKELPADKKLYITGCGALRNGQIDPSFFETYTELLPYKNQIELLPEEPFNNTNPTIAGKFSHKIPAFNGNTLSIAEKISRAKKELSSAGELTRKTLVIQTGCDNFCTFCLTVQARGRHAYRPLEDIIEDIQTYVSAGGKEVVLTGINLGAWGATSSINHEESRITELIDAILKETEIKRLRISSLGVEFLTPKLIGYFGNPRIVAYAHLSVQSGSDSILQNMKRHYTRAELLERLTALRNIQRPDGVQVQIGADLIVGFPGETEDDWQDTYSLVDLYGITQLHAFPFSAHTEKYHVPAGNFPNQVPEHTKLHRLRELIALGEKRKQEFIESQKNIPLQLLLEGNPSETIFKGWSQNYIELSEENFMPAPGSKMKKGEIILGICLQ